VKLQNEQDAINKSVEEKKEESEIAAQEQKGIS